MSLCLRLGYSHKSQMYEAFEKCECGFENFYSWLRDEVEKARRGWVNAKSKRETGEGLKKPSAPNYTGIPEREKAKVCANLDEVVKLMAEIGKGRYCSREVYEAIPAYRQSDFRSGWKIRCTTLLEKYPPARPAYFRDGRYSMRCFFDTPEQVAEKFIVVPTSTGTRTHGKIL